MYGLTFSFRLSCLLCPSSSTGVNIVVVVKTKEDFKGEEVRKEAAGLQAVFLRRRKGELRFAIDALQESSNASLSQSQRHRNIAWRAWQQIDDPGVGCRRRWVGPCQRQAARRRKGSGDGS